MSKEYTTCRVEHRDYVPYDYIAIEFCEVEFIGKNARQYENEWHNIKFAKCRKREKEIKNIDTTLQIITKELEFVLNLQSELKEEIKSLRKKLSIFRRLFKGDTGEILIKKEKLEQLISTENHRIDKYNKLINLKNDLDEDKFYSQYELMRKIERYLENKGFRIINSSQSGGECKEQIDIWQKEYD